MKLKELLKGIEYEGDPGNVDITDITFDSRRAGVGMLFACFTGRGADGHAYAGQAVEKGCAALLAEHPTGAPAPHILVKDSKAAYSRIAANFFGNPAEKLRLFGVTGTNGKTTVTFLLKHIFEQNGIKCGLIGTTENLVGGESIPAHYTTPEPRELNWLFRRMLDSGCKAVVMEVSSQALDQGRVAGLRFEAGIFTNLTEDHLDYHGTMENYLLAKRRLFLQAETGVVNKDDPSAGHITKDAGCRVVTYSAEGPADFTAEDVSVAADSVAYTLGHGGQSRRVRLRMTGGFNVLNSLACAACAVSAGVPFDRAADALQTAEGARGRAEVVPTGRDFSVILDYAHTPDALDKILHAMNAVKKGRLVLLFGCGGDRDRAKRPIMGKIAAQNADYIIITSDNPRTEEPAAIIDDILRGFEGISPQYTRIDDRKKAIRYALEHAQKDDLILLAGKGHEDYQILGTRRIHFDEREIVAGILQELDKAAEPRKNERDCHASHNN